MESIKPTPTPWEHIYTTSSRLNETLERCLVEMSEDVLPEYYEIVTRDEHGEMVTTSNIQEETFNMIRAGHQLLAETVTKRDPAAILAAIKNLQSIIKHITEEVTYGDETCGSREAIRKHLEPLLQEYQKILDTIPRLKREPEFGY